MDTKEFIKKAVQWLEINTAEYATFDGDYWRTKQKFLDDFAEAMNETDGETVDFICKDSHVDNKVTPKTDSNDEDCEQVFVGIYADKGHVADFLEKVAKYVRENGEEFDCYETSIGCADTDR